jgi:hypothetical protein
MSPYASDDLSLAKEVLLKDNLTFVLAKSGKVLFKSKSHGISDLLAMLDSVGRRTEGASLADSIVGRAAALVCVYSKITAVYGVSMSEGALSIFRVHGVHYEFGTLVPRILNRAKDDVCPFDKAISGVEDPRAALDRLKSLKLG